LTRSVAVRIPRPEGRVPEIVISEFMDEAAVERLRDAHDVLYDPALADRPDDLAAAVRAARALIVRNRTQVRGPLLGAAPRLVVVGRLGVGLDNIDLADCRERGIEVHPATGANEDAVAEWVVGAMLYLVRGAFNASDGVLAGEWPRTALVGGELGGRRLGLVGFGAIARKVARIAGALGMQLGAYDPFVPAEAAAWAEADRYGELALLLSDADVLSLHVPLSDATHHLIDATALARLPAGAIVINSARGGLIDEPALAEALRAGRLAGAALDVFESEPLSARAAQVFRGAPNLLLTPHIAGVTRESNVRVSAVVASRVLQSLARVG
jgi:(S)-sulfolactate dehydrogenase